MNHGTVASRLLRASTLALLLALAWLALSGGVRQLPRAGTLGQQVETWLQLACGAASLGVVVTCFRWRRWAGAVRAVWTVSLAGAAGLSGLVWGPPMALLALLFAAVATSAALAVLWVLRRTAGR